MFNTAVQHRLDSHSLNDHYNTYKLYDIHYTVESPMTKALLHATMLHIIICIMFIICNRNLEKQVKQNI